MLFRQLFDRESCTYTYLLAGDGGKEALIIDPVLDRVDRYIQLLDELGLKLGKVVDTHVHADHISGMGALRDRTHCVTVMGEQSGVDVVSVRVRDGDRFGVEGVELSAIYTPGHTDDSYSFRMADRVFTGDTLLIRGTGRTDFQHGSSADAYESIFSKLLTLPDSTLVYPGHDYKGDTVSTIAEEKAFNPRLQVSSAQEYAEIMDNLNLANPKMMDVAVPANLQMGLSQDELEAQGHSVSCDSAAQLVEDSSTVLVDLRDASERQQSGAIPGAVHAPYADLDSLLAKGGLLHELTRSTDKRVVFYCAYGERSAMAVQAAQKLGLQNTLNLKGGLAAWKQVGGPTEAIDA